MTCSQIRTASETLTSEYTFEIRRTGRYVYRAVRGKPRALQQCQRPEIVCIRAGPQALKARLARCVDHGEQRSRHDAPLLATEPVPHLTRVQLR